MNYNFDGLLINVLILFLFILFVPLFLNRKLKLYSRNRRIAILTSSAAIGIIACISFSIFRYNEFLFDLRYVVSLIVGLYCGLPATITLWLVTIIFRTMLGGIGIYSNLITATVVFIITSLVYKRFKKLSRLDKIVMAASLSIAITLFDIFVSVSFFHVPFQYPNNLQYFLLHVCTTIFIIYFLEIIREFDFMKKRLMQAEKMEIVSQLASSISHEVRNPMTVVRGFLQLLHQTDLPKEKQNEYLSISISEIDRANAIIRDYLSFAKPSEINFTHLNVMEELERAITIITPLANMSCVEIHTNIDPYYIEGNSQLFQQCLLNITKNSIEAMKDNGTLTISTKKDRNYLVIEIKDTGIGMSEAQLARLGEPYFSTKGERGTGLGMMAVLHIIELLKGKYRVHSKVNEGTTFMLYFPIVEK